MRSTLRRPFRRMFRFRRPLVSKRRRPLILPTLFPFLIFLFLFLLPTPSPPPLPPPPPQPSAPLRSRVDKIVSSTISPRAALLSSYRIPDAVVSTLSPDVAARLYWKLVFTDVVTALRSPDAEFVPRARAVFVHPQNGLGNRLRALASGIALARMTGRVPVVVWERDAHLGAPFEDLFEMRSRGNEVDAVLYEDLIVVDKWPKWEEINERNGDWFGVNYMQKDGAGARPNEVIRFGRVRNKHVGPKEKAVNRRVHLYFKSAYVAATRPKGWGGAEVVNGELRRLRVSRKVRQVFAKVNQTELENSIGVHVRSRTLERDNVVVDRGCEYTIRGSETTNFWRSQSQGDVFAKQMKKLQTRDEDVKFFVAADDVKVVRDLKKEFGKERVMNVERDCDDRERSCVVFAMVDLMCLARTKKIYGSYWSSFTEAAVRMGGKKVYLNGIDFGDRIKVRKIRRRAQGIWEKVERWGMNVLGYEVPAWDSPFADCRRRRKG